MSFNPKVGKTTQYSQLIDYKESEGHHTFSVKKPHLRYLNEFVGLKCAPELLELEVFPNAKEITESFAAYRAVKRNLNLDLGDPRVLVVCVGDGSTPRTGATFAFMSKWTAVSIDPAMREHVVKKMNKAVRRLLCVSGKIEDGLVHPSPHTFHTIVVVCVHSHAPFEATLEATKPDTSRGQIRHLVSLPCCTRTWLDREPDIQYDDWGIFSPERAVMIWKDV